MNEEKIKNKFTLSNLKKYNVIIIRHCKDLKEILRVSLLMLQCLSFLHIIRYLLFSIFNTYLHILSRTLKNS